MGLLQSEFFTIFVSHNLLNLLSHIFYGDDEMGGFQQSHNSCGFRTAATLVQAAVEGGNFNPDKIREVAKNKIKEWGRGVVALFQPKYLDIPTKQRHVCQSTANSEW